MVGLGYSIDSQAAYETVLRLSIEVAYLNVVVIS